MKDLRTRIIDQGVKNLLEYGYPNVNSKNILIDPIYKEFFLSMLKDLSNQTDNPDITKVLNVLIEEVSK